MSTKARNYHLEVDWEDGLTVVVPKRWSQHWVDRLVTQKRDWIEKHLGKLEIEKEKLGKNTLAKPMTVSQIKDLVSQEVTKISQAMQISFGRVSVKYQKTRWGSCSSKGNLNFNAFLALAPFEVRSYVIVHELAHRLVANHSKKFWRLVEMHCPGYKEHRIWLRKNGRILMQAGSPRRS